MAKTSITELVLYAVTMAMGLVSIVIMILNGQGIMELELDTIVILLGIGVFCVGLAGLNKATKTIRIK
jgi:hypothetical protein